MITRTWKLLALGAGLIVIGLAFIPTVPRRSDETATARAASRAQLAQYVTALNLFWGEYGEFPSFMQGREHIELSSPATAEPFIEVLSGRDRNGNPSTNYGNHRAIQFYQFSAAELHHADALGYRMPVDHFGNTNIVLCLDHDGDGTIQVPSAKGPTSIRATVAAYTIPSEAYPSVRTW